MIQNVLVPIDLSESSLNALDTAVAIAKKHQATLYILSIEETYFDSTDDFSFPYGSRRSDPSDILTALAGAIQHKSDITPKIIQETGNVSDLIIKVSLKYRTDLIVMGSHGASGYREGFVGSNTYKVIKQATCSVLSMPVRKKIISFKKILFPIRPIAGGLALYEIVRAFTQPNTLLDVLGISNRLMESNTGVLNTILDEIREQLEMDKVQTRVAWGDGGAIVDDVMNYAQHSNPDLIIATSDLDITSKPRFIGPYMQKIINCAKTPVLSVKKINVPSFV